jgi:hypothetical protein
VAPRGATLRLDFDLGTDEPGRFFAQPWPTDLWLDDAGRPRLQGFPRSGELAQIAELAAMAGERPGWSVVPVAYFPFDAPLAPGGIDAPQRPAPSDPLLLVSLDEGTDRGRLFPVVSHTFSGAMGHLLAVGVAPGVVLEPGHRYAFVVRRALGDAQGRPLGVPEALVALREGRVPEGRLGAKAATIHAPLWPVLASLDIDLQDVAATTVFTPGDVVASLSSMADGVAARDDATLEGVHFVANHPRYCELGATVRIPTYQRGEPPFDTDGRFDTDEAGLPRIVSTTVLPVTLTLPRGPQPADGHPLMLYLHGSGGVSTQVVDRGRTSTPGGAPTPGEGPAHVVALAGLATASTALPLNPERLPGASAFVYLNVKNLPVFRDTFREGVLEQRLFVDALSDLRLAPDVVALCAGLDPSATGFRFDLSRFAVMGQSMGAMYANLVGATDPRVRLLVPAGAGGYWSYFFTKTSMLSDSEKYLLSVVLGLDGETSHLHPSLQLMQTAWEWVDPLVATPRLGRRPLPGHPARSVAEGVGLDDEYFPPPIFDAIAAGYGNQLAGDAVWPSLPATLSLVNGETGPATYPVAANRRSASGEPWTGTVTAWRPDGILGGHDLFFQLSGLKFQYRCFLESALRTGTATLFAPAGEDDACPR